jgi:hypothetical protein
MEVLRPGLVKGSDPFMGEQEGDGHVTHSIHVPQGEAQEERLEGHTVEITNPDV